MSDLADLTNGALGDMRIEIVKRELNQGALSAFASTVTDYGARLVLTALDAFDEEVRKAEYRRGFEAGESNAALVEADIRAQERAAVAGELFVMAREYDVNDDDWPGSAMLRKAARRIAPEPTPKEKP